MKIEHLINDHREYKKIFNEIVNKNNDNISTVSEMKKSIIYWSNYFNVSKLEYIRRLKVYISFYRTFWFSLDIVNNYYTEENKYKKDNK